MSAHLQVAGLPQSTEAVHETRVSIKRIHAVLKVFDLDHKNKRIKKLQKKEIDTVFKTAGKLRDIEIQAYLLKDYENLMDQDFSHLASKLNEKIGRRQKKLRKILSDRQKDFLLMLQDEVTAELESLTDEKISEHIRNYRVKAIKVAEKNRQKIVPKILHKQRMLLKEIRFCFEMTDEMAQNPDAGDQISRIKEIEDLLGSWHDYNILNRTVEKFTQKLKKSRVDDVINMNSLAHTISNDIILLLDKYRKVIPNLLIKPEAGE